MTLITKEEERKLDNPAKFFITFEVPETLYNEYSAMRVSGEKMLQDAKATRFDIDEMLVNFLFYLAKARLVGFSDGISEIAKSCQENRPS